MALPSMRNMPTVTATYSDLRKQWLIALPGNVEIAVPQAEDVPAVVPQAEDVPAVVARRAPGSAIAYLNPSSIGPVAGAHRANP